MKYTDYLALRTFSRISSTRKARPMREELCALTTRLDELVPELVDSVDSVESVRDDDKKTLDFVRERGRIYGLFAERSKDTFRDHLNRLEKMAALFNLEREEVDLLEILSYLHGRGQIATVLTEALGRHFLPNDPDTIESLAAILKTDVGSIAEHLDPSAKLSRVGLICVDRDYDARVVQSAAYWIRKSALEKASDVGDLKDHVLGAPLQATLAWGAFSGHVRCCDFAKSLLMNAARDQAPGVNILIHGYPGTGKTEFAKTLAAECGISLHSIGDVDGEGEDVTREGRMAAMRAASKLLDQVATALLVDEADDVLLIDGSHASTRRARKITSGGSKYSLLKLLESNVHPVIWIMNDASYLDPATVRRMSLVIEMTPPPINIRRDMWRNSLSSLTAVDAESLAHQLASDERISPALGASAIRSAQIANGGEGEIRGYVSAAMSLMYPEGPPPTALCSSGTSTAPFNPAWINCKSADWGTLQGMKWTSGDAAFSLLVSGVPGTGKSAYAKWICDSLGMRSRIVPVSDIASPYVGQTERNMAKCFESARRDSTILIFDEIDSLLMARAGDSRRWERSEVNELLVQMDRHSIPVICTTNDVDVLDRAAMRRFTFRLTFEPFEPIQALRAVKETFGLSILPADIPAGLVPADLANISRRLNVLKRPVSPEYVRQALHEETRVRGAQSRSIGFSAELTRH